MTYSKWANGAITMIDAQTGELKEIGTGSYNVTKWVVPTMMTS